MEQSLRDERNNDLALFRYGLIAPVITNTHNEKSEFEYFSKISANKFSFEGKEVSLNPSTLKYWAYKYRKEGFDGLKRKTRTDFNSTRKISEETKNEIVNIKNTYPHITATLIYKKLAETGFINPNDVSLSTVTKYIRDNPSLFEETNNIDRKAFVMEFANDCWQADTSHGAYLTINNKKELTYLIAIIDDASRIIVDAKFYFNDNALNFQDSFKRGIKKYGVPKRLFVDNGSSYKNTQLSIICASIGTVLIHARPFSGASKGKVERFFHTLKASWLRGLNWNEIPSIDALNELLAEFINEYNSKEHSSLNYDGELMTPHTRWFKDQNLIKKLDNDFIDNCFLHTAYPTIRSDAIAHIKTRDFEVDMKYIGKKITVKYNPNDFTEAWIYENDKPVEMIKEVDRVANSKVKRKTSIY